MKKPAKVPRNSIPLTADAGDAIFVLILLVLVAAAVLLLMSVIFMAVAAAAAFGPTVAGVFWWASLRQRYRISRNMKKICLLLGIVLFLLPLASILILEPSAWQHNRQAWLIALWLGALLGLCGTALFLSAEAYRQVFWPHCKKNLQDKWRTMPIRIQAWKDQRHLSRIGSALDFMEAENEEIILEYKRLSKMIDSLIQSADAAFLSAERLRWQREYAQMSLHELESRRKQLGFAIERTARHDPRATSFLLEAAVARLERQDRMLRILGNMSYADARKEFEARLSSVAASDRKLHSIWSQMNERTAHMRRLRQTQPVVH